MEETLFRILLGIGLLGWVWPLVDRPSEARLGELRGPMNKNTTKIAMMVGPLILLLLSLAGLIGMFFSPGAFRWVYLIAVTGMIAGTWFLPVASNKPKRDLAFGEFLRVVDGAILGIAFFSLSSIAVPASAPGLR